MGHFAKGAALRASGVMPTPSSSLLRGGCRFFSSKLAPSGPSSGRHGSGGRFPAAAPPGRGGRPCPPPGWRYAPAACPEALPPGSAAPGSAGRTGAPRNPRRGNVAPPRSGKHRSPITATFPLGLNIHKSNCVNNRTCVLYYKSGECRFLGGCLRSGRLKEGAQPSTATSCTLSLPGIGPG
jgi:hypothetical protein